MADVVLVCVREDLDCAEALGQMFDAEGFSVGDASSEGDVGVLVWSPAAGRSPSFHAAARRASKRGPVVVACLSPAPGPLQGIGAAQVFELSTWNGDPEAAALVPLADAVSDLIAAGLADADEHTARAAPDAAAEIDLGKIGLDWSGYVDSAWTRPIDGDFHRPAPGGRDEAAAPAAPPALVKPLRPRRRVRLAANAAAMRALALVALIGAAALAANLFPPASNADVARPPTSLDLAYAAARAREANPMALQRRADARSLDEVAVHGLAIADAPRRALRRAERASMQRSGFQSSGSVSAAPDRMGLAEDAKDEAHQIAVARSEAGKDDPAKPDRA